MSKQVCSVAGKQAYPTQRAAIKAALSYSKKRGTALRVYRCPDCHSLHLTKRPKRSAVVDNIRGAA